ncbi:pentatricopeptide repeat protein [Colletotrichum plurivorum]|uniref:Pentatricopeptide repeat protein n=1 Tax=Colletotrichum plurivorum TaxID=2175906 RepID=A0A8H6NKD0_9PEZI|nr:pentatricopeptide repeat protein [Colletotrichum plurivorum]
MAKVATDFEKIINEGRERKKNEALAQKIFSRDRRQSAPTKLKPGAGPSLASRVGVNKQRTASQGPKAVPAGNIDGDWTHDLHGTVNGGGRRSGGAGGLAARISAPESRPAPASTNRRAERRAEQRAAKVAAAIARSDTMADVQMTSVPPVSTVNKGLSIRGLAGPFAVMAQNFAPGTTAADIESAMTPVGGEMLSCRIVKTSPLLVAEMVFASKEGGDAVISTFNNQTADGRIIKVYPKPGGYKETMAQPSTSASRDVGRSTSNNVIDGSHGFPEPMEADGLYSDNLLGRSNGNGGSNRRGRGFNRGGRR